MDEFARFVFDLFGGLASGFVERRNWWKLLLLSGCLRASPRGDVETLSQ